MLEIMVDGGDLTLFLNNEVGPVLLQHFIEVLGIVRMVLNGVSPLGNRLYVYAIAQGVTQVLKQNGQCIEGGVAIAHEQNRVYLSGDWEMQA